VAWLNKLGPQAGINASAILHNRGEFALILATLSLGAGLDDRIQPFAGLYVLVMAVIGPLLAANSERIGGVLLRKRKTAGAADRNRRAAPRHSEEIALMEAALAGDRLSGEISPGDIAVDGPTKSELDATRADDDLEAVALALGDAPAASVTGWAAVDDYDDYDLDDDVDTTESAVYDAAAEQAGQQSDQRATRQRDPEY
jgi:CPA2 family monovalent cation:H+ antiporter-2